ncbi:NAD-dependent epimerase/dehydratase family protein [Sphingomonas sp. CFBP 13728]|uniref:NAD-dependent epimerase/dehydratase family protein n=1 Tax=Sphingomonas sp. CFBP 13728 TaxID=2775294 RepID=UPI00177B848D|nr:NAD-dependent epimerase/dehydratase family protein [Sphingomonas sp. CFBP 13728]MBD8620604.1 NAD-dependent epimerase/dehydratase family protein [Sphingomonas sp. CFBP 13728]
MNKRASDPSEDEGPTLVLVGAQSRAGRAIRQAWPGRIVAVHRGKEPGLTLADYTQVPDGVIPSGSVVVNCVGTPIGTDAVLHRINHDVALRWAKAAKAAGATRFIQMSSFAVYGSAMLIDADTPELPETAYGRSKLGADQDLCLCAAPGFGVTIVRIPMLFGDGSDKLTRLVGFVRTIGMVPRVMPPIARAMLGYDALAAAIRALTLAPVDGVVHIADPTAFSYELLRERIERVTGRLLRSFPVSAAAGAIAHRIAPAVHSRLLASSRLAPEVAYRFAMPMGGSLVDALDRIAAGTA